MFIITIIIHSISALIIFSTLMRLRSISVNVDMKQKATQLWNWFGCAVFVLLADMVAQYYFGQWFVWLIADIVAISALGFAFRDTQAIAKQFSVSLVPTNGWLLQLWLLWAACIVLTIAQCIWFIV